MKLKKIKNRIFVDPLYNKKSNYYKRVGYFSGTFDPFHNGHKEVIKLVLDYVDEVWVQPHNFNPKKNPIDIAHRMYMISLAIEDLPNVYLLDYPQKLSRDKYKLMKDFEKGVEGLIVVDIIGQDHLKKTIEREVMRDTCCVTRRDFQMIQHPRIKLIKGDHEAVSSSKIREQIKLRNCKNLELDSRILAYILENRLYQ